MSGANDNIARSYNGLLFAHSNCSLTPYDLKQHIHRCLVRGDNFSRFKNQIDYADIGQVYYPICLVPPRQFAGKGECPLLQFP